MTAEPVERAYVCVRTDDLPEEAERVRALRLEQLAYEAALASTGRVPGPSMREFLR